MLPINTVVITTSEREVVTMTSLLGTSSSILRTRPKATAPLIIPAYEMKTSSFKGIPELYPNKLYKF